MVLNGYMIRKLGLPDGGIELDHLYDVPARQCILSGLNEFCSDELDGDQKTQFTIVCKLIKDLIFEYANKNGYKLNGIQTYNIVNTLNEIIDLDWYEEYLVGFNPLYCTNKEQLDAYLNRLLSDKNYEEINQINAGFGEIEKCFNAYFRNRWKELLDLSEKIDNLDNNLSIEEKEDLTEAKLQDYIKYINTLLVFKEYHDNIVEIEEKLYSLFDKKKLEYFYSDKRFSKMFDAIMEHDRKKHTYHFHGSQGIENANNILDKGFGMVRIDLSTTSYPEFTKDDVILYKRGLGDTIGKDAVIIIDEPKDENGKPIEIVKKCDPNTDIRLEPSGNQVLTGIPNYVIDTKYIVGYVDKVNRKIVFNPNYYDYEKFRELDTNISKKNS